VTSVNNLMPQCWGMSPGYLGNGCSPQVSNMAQSSTYRGSERPFSHLRIVDTLRAPEPPPPETDLGPLRGGLGEARMGLIGPKRGCR
jgi:hypothetical protein